MAEAQQSNTETVQADAFSILATWNYSLAAFYLRRWQRQMELPVRLVSAASPADLGALRRAFEADLLADYSEQAAALHRTCAGLANATGEPDSSYGAELLKAQEHAALLIEQAKAQAERIVASAEVRAREIIAAADPNPTPRRANG